jgi:Rrf2 family protein
MISEVASIPAHYVSKVMRQLVVAGLVKGRRGRQGGFTLGRRPDEIRFADVLDAVSENIDPERCAFGQPRCNPSQPCPLHPAWERLQEDFARWAGTSTFAP